MTKQPNDRTITDGSGDPNVWYMSGLIPLAIDLKTPLRWIIRIARMIPSDWASPLVGMAGLARHDQPASGLLDASPSNAGELPGRRALSAMSSWRCAAA